MTGRPRLLAVMGSGETAPTMAKVHRLLVERLGPAPVDAVLLDTPYGFQENADELSRRTAEYFARSTGASLAIATWRTASDDVVLREQALARIRNAGYVFAGPGSPTYALQVWAGSRVREVLAGTLGRGGCVTFASAAAATLGVRTVPVYEIYKAGFAPSWVEGLDLLAVTGLRAAVIPHYDNAEGGTHDTRFCYLGERRLRMLADSEETDGPEAPRAALRGMVVRLGELAAVGARDPLDPLAPIVDTVIELREQARTAGSWTLANTLRAGLAGVGIEVRDTVDGPVWLPAPRSAPDDRC